jgi:hypothetical protein
MYCAGKYFTIKTGITGRRVSGQINVEIEDKDSDTVELRRLLAGSGEHK